MSAAPSADGSSAPSPPDRRDAQERRGRPRVLIVGAGFAGLQVARRLRRAPVEVVVLDRANHHLFQPLLYQVATATLNPSDVARPVRAVFRRAPNVRTLLAEVRGIDLEKKEIEHEGGRLSYDWLVLAPGMRPSYFGNDAWREHAPSLKTVEDALEIRRRVLTAFEKAERAPEESDRWLNFVVIGAGPTGVELAGALAEIARKALRHEYRAIDPRRARILLLEGLPRVLPTYPEELSESARAQLETLGVEVRTGTMVDDIDGEGVTLEDGERIPSRTVLWAAGLEPVPLLRDSDLPKAESGLIEVNEDLSVPGHPNVFVIGDAAAMRSDGEEVPGIAPAAMQAGRHVARLLAREARDGPGHREPFHYRHKGLLATIGWARAVADLGRIRARGLLAWLLWMLVHVVFLVGFRNRIFVLLQWAWSYLSFRRGARLITHRNRETTPSD